MSETKITPMLQQYLDIKKRYPEEIVMFRLGDFYEMFMEDAIEVSKMLQLTLTKRGETPMCGVPHHSSKHYFYKLIQMGKKIAIAEQFTDPNNPDLMKRDVVEIITPATLIDISDYEKNNFLCSIYFQKPTSLTLSLFFSAVDSSTGELEVFSEITKDFQNAIKHFLSLYRPKELILPPYYHDVLPKNFFSNYPILINTANAYLNRESRVKEIILETYQLQSLHVLGLNEEKQMLYPLAYLFDYLQNNYQQKLLSHLKYPVLIERNEHLQLDYNTLRNLEILENNETKTSKNSLFESINETLTPMGKRLLQQYLTKPLFHLEAIKKRQDKVEILLKQAKPLEELRLILKGTSDFSRFASKIALGRILPKELITLKNSLQESLKLIPLIKTIKIDFFKNTQTDILEDVLETLKTTLLAEPNNQINEGGVINEAINEDLKRLNHAKQEGSQWMIELLEKEKEKTGISSLKIKYTEQAGYFFELSKQHLKNLPSHFILSKTMVNASRFITEELLKLQGDILESKEKAIQIEISLYENLKNKLRNSLREIQLFCDEVAALDVIQSFAKKAMHANYTRPIFNDGEEIKILKGRHPVIEQKVENYIPNDLIMSKKHHLHILTGPNMAGKSTFLRQNATIFILAQIGSFVPAESAHIPLIDKLFTRIGTSDNLSEGQSTFLVEMSESAYILNHATSKSFIIMDEIGRGTSTYDGMSIAHAILNYIVQKIGAFTLFATHYHELYDLNNAEAIKSYTMMIDKKNNELVLLHKVVEGAGNHSYGIHVAKLSGLPKDLLKQASLTLEKIENSLLPKSKESMSLFDFPQKNSQTVNPEETYLSSEEKSVISALKDFDVNAKSPLEALRFIDELKQRLD